MDIDNKILEMFREKGMMIELGANFSAKGQIAQLLDVVKPLLLEIDELRAYKEAAEKQGPTHIIDWEFDDDPDDADARGDLIIHQLNGAEYPAGTPLYAKPVPAEKPAVAVPGEVRRTLERIAKWYGEFPEAPPFQGRPQSYGAAYGSNGERDYMRDLATKALELLASAPSNSPQIAALVPECFSRLYENALGMRFGEDWNEGSAAYYHRNKLLLAVRDCADFYKSSGEQVTDDFLKDADRYRRLRLTGAAPCGSKQLGQGTVLRFQSLDSYIDEDIKTVRSRGEIDFDKKQSRSQKSDEFTLGDLNIIRQWYNCVRDCNPNYLQDDGFDDKETYEKVLKAIDRYPSHESEQGGAS